MADACLRTRGQREITPDHQRLVSWLPLLPLKLVPGHTADDKALREGAIECSMSRKGDCWDNAVAESFFATFKREMHDADSIETPATGTLSAKQFIETYNYRRRHSSIGYRTPVEFELLHSLKQRSA